MIKKPYEPLENAWINILGGVTPKHPFSFIRLIRGCKASSWFTPVIYTRTKFDKVALLTRLLLLVHPKVDISDVTRTCKAWGYILLYVAMYFVKGASFPSTMTNG